MTQYSHAEIEALLTAPGAPFELEPLELNGIRLRTFKHAPLTLPGIFEATVRFNEREYLVYEDERVTYAQARALVEKIAGALQAMGIEKGDRVAIAMRNYPEAVIAFWAIVHISGVAVPMNAWWGSEELGFALEDCGAAALFADRERWARVAAGAIPRALRHAIVCRGEPSNTGGIKVSSWSILLEGEPATPFTPVALSPEDNATLFYTSGTTGRPKGALGTHRNICLHVMNGAYARARTLLRAGEPLPDPTDVQPQKTALLTVPLFHVTGCHSILVSGTAGGNKIVMMYRWDPTQALALIERERVTAFGGVPTVAWQILESPHLASTDTSSVESIGYGGAPAAPELVTRIQAAFPAVQPGTGYGLTESSSAVTVNSGADYIAHPDSVGLTLPCCDLQIIDEDGMPVPPGERGELLVRGPVVFKGYWQRDEATAETITPEGWLRTGDIARIDSDGFVYILDRAKDMIIRGGENVYCVEIEDTLFSHADVVDAAVYGVPHRTLGEEVAAAVQLKRGATTTAGALQAHVAEHLAHFKVPQHMRLYAEPLPRNPNGKILKRALAEAHTGEGQTHTLGEWSSGDGV